MQISNPNAYQHLLKRQTLHSSISCANHGVPSQRSIPSFITCVLPTNCCRSCSTVFVTCRTWLHATEHSARRQKSLCQQANTPIPHPHPTLYGTRSFINIFIRSRYRSLLRARSIHSTHHLSLCNSNIIIPSVTTSSSLYQMRVLGLNFLWI